MFVSQFVYDWYIAKCQNCSFTGRDDMINNVDMIQLLNGGLIEWLNEKNAFASYIIYGWWHSDKENMLKDVSNKVHLRKIYLQSL